MMSLNSQQRKAIKDIKSHLLVLAGAGSGKTKVITEKIAYLIKSCQINSQHILAVTFTNKAAYEMRARIQNMVSKQAIKDLQLSTFHVLGLRILQHSHKQLGYRRGFTILDSHDSQTLLKEILLDKNIAYSHDEIKASWEISGLKNKTHTPESALQGAETNHDMDLATLYSHYQRQLLAYNAVDFDDLILQPLKLLSESVEIKQHWQSRIRYMLVDEYQDTNACQYELIKLLLGQNCFLTAVGDDDQSIYAWRGARPENLTLLTKDFPSLKVVKLEQNYRSTGRILKCANQLIKNNPHIFEKNLWCEIGYGDPIKVIPCKSAEDEAERIVSELLHNKFNKRSLNRDFAILYRSNHQSRLFENVLRLHNIPYKVSGGISFFDRTEIKDILAYFKLLVNPQDDAAFLRIINTPRREIGAGTIEKINQLASNEAISLMEACWSNKLECSVSGAPFTRISRFVDWINEKMISIDACSAFQMAQTIIADIDYRDWLANTSNNKEQAERRIENINSLLEWIKNMCVNDENLTLNELVNKLSLMDILERQDKDSNEDAVQLITIHAAKGLEFNNVFLVGFEEGQIPHSNNESDNHVEEERRLAYVGITRARKNLTITFAETRKRNGEHMSCTPSRFLNELPIEELDWEGLNINGDSDRKEKGNASLHSLREMLSQQS